MSGVRVWDPELRALGLTLPGFVERGRVIASLPSLGLLTLAAHTPPHWEVVYREVEDLAGVDFTGFDLVGISSLSARIHDAYALADRIRTAGVPVVLGGLHASALPEEALSHATAVVQGEGERAWPRLMADFEAGALRPLYSSIADPSLWHDLAEARVPRFELLDPARYDRLTLQTTRGCPRDCSFCAASRTLSGFKTKPIAQLRRELDALVRIWPRAFVELADDNTFAAKGWARDLVRTLGEYALRWFTETDLSVAEDPDLLEAIAGAGCAQLLIGLEAVLPSALRGLDGRNWKAAQAERAAESVRRIQSFGIPVNGCFMLGLDGDDRGAFERILDFVEASGLCDVQITLLTPFPGTPLFQKLRADGRLPRSAYWEQCTLFDLTFSPLGMTAAQLRDGFRDLMERLYCADAAARRRSRWRSVVRARTSSKETA